MVTSHIAEDEVPQVKRSPWADNFFRPLLITIMIMCFNLSLVNLVRLINPNWRGTYFLIGMLLTTIEAIYSQRLLKLLHMRGISVLRYRLAEWGVLVVMLKILSFANKPLALVWAELQLMWREPGSFISLEFYVLLSLAFIAWLIATNTMANFEELHDPYTFRSDNILPLDELVGRFFGGGILLVLISGVTQWLSRAGWSSLIDFQRPSLSGVILNVMVYFTLGLVLLSQAHLTTLLVRWEIQKIKVASNLVKQWAKYGLLFLGFMTLLVFFLPTGYSLGFLASAAIVIYYVFNVLTFLLRLLLVLISLPVLWLFNLLGLSPQRPTAPPALPPLLPEAAAGPAPISWLEALRSFIFWLLAIAIGAYLIKVYLTDHPELIRTLRKFRLLGLLIHLIEEWWRWLRGLAQTGWELIPARVRSDKRTGQTTARGPLSWLGLRRLSPRQQILSYYLNIVKRAEKAGQARQGHQTPYEYEPELSQAAPEAQTAVNLLTKAFVHARYSRGPFHEAQAALARSFWQQIRRELRQKQKPEEGGTEDGVAGST